MHTSMLPGLAVKNLVVIVLSFVAATAITPGAFAGETVLKLCDAYKIQDVFMTVTAQSRGHERF